MFFFFCHPAVSSYINWGRKTCPQVNGTKLLYSGKLLENKKKYYGFNENKKKHMLSLVNTQFRLKLII